jgi:hypothetical protein
MAILYWTNEDTGELVTFKFDVTTSEDPTDAVTITDHPVEKGANIVDHARDEPEIISLEGYVTNTPHQGNLTEDDDNKTGQLTLSVHARRDVGTKVIQLDVPDPPIGLSPSGLIQAGVVAVGNLILGAPDNKATVIDDTDRITTTAQATALTSSRRRNRAREAYEKILDAKRNHDLITIQGSVREYFDMLISRVGAPRKPEDGDGILFQIDLRRLRIAESETVQSPKPTESRGSLTKSQGSQGTKTDPNADKKPVASSAYRLAHPAEFPNG